jgi:vancomycin permeability regulator SanA
VPEAAAHAALGLGSVFVLMTALGLALTWSRVVRCGRSSEGVVSADVILVFGAATRPDGRPSPELEARLTHAAALYRQGRAGIVLCSGGHPGENSEPRVMRAALIRLGVPANAILTDETGSSTRRSIAGLKRLGIGRWRSALFVSSSYHLHRILAEAHRQGVTAAASAAVSTPITQRFGPRTRQRAREVAASWWYALTPVTSGPRALAKPWSAPARGALPRPLSGEPAARRLG